MKFALFAMCAAAAWPSAMAAAAERTLEHQGVVDAPVAEVWSAFTTSEGFTSWAVKHAQIDLRIGGEMRSSYHPDSNLHDEHTIVNRIISYEPQRMLSIRNEQAPAGFKNAELFHQTWSVIYFEPLGPHRTNLRIIGLGYGEGPDWDEVYNKFKIGNAVTLERLQQKFASISALSDDTARILELMHQMVGGDWIHENSRPDGGVFRARVRFEFGPDHQSLVGSGWLGDADGMLYHGATQVWREPPSKPGAALSAVRFQSINERGDIARGDITLHDPQTVEWNWNATAINGNIQRYRVRMTFEDDAHYRFMLHLLNEDGGSPRELVNIRYERVARVPERFVRMKAASGSTQ